MNVVGRQMSRSSSSSHHQRQYSDHFIETASSNKWLQSSSLSQVLHFISFFENLLILIVPAIAALIFSIKTSHFLCRTSVSMAELRAREWAGASWRTLRLLPDRGPRAWERMATIKSPPVSSAPACSISIPWTQSYYQRLVLPFIFGREFLNFLFLHSKCTR